MPGNGKRGNLHAAESGKQMMQIQKKSGHLRRQPAIGPETIRKKDIAMKSDDAALLHGPAPGRFLCLCKTTS
jgi:hypothetical protein